MSARRGARKSSDCLQHRATSRQKSLDGLELQVELKGHGRSSQNTSNLSENEYRNREMRIANTAPLLNPGEETTRCSRRTGLTMPRPVRQGWKLAEVVMVAEALATSRLNRPVCSTLTTMCYAGPAWNQPIIATVRPHPKRVTCRRRIRASAQRPCFGLALLRSIRPESVMTVVRRATHNTPKLVLYETGAHAWDLPADAPGGAGRQATSTSKCDSSLQRPLPGQVRSSQVRSGQVR